MEPFAIFRPLMEPKCIQFANKDEGLKRREHYCKVLSEEAVKRNFPQLQQVLSLIGVTSRLVHEHFLYKLKRSVEYQSSVTAYQSASCYSHGYAATSVTLHQS